LEWLDKNRQVKNTYTLLILAHPVSLLFAFIHPLQTFIRRQKHSFSLYKHSFADKNHSFSKRFEPAFILLFCWLSFFLWFYMIHFQDFSVPHYLLIHSIKFNLAGRRHKILLLFSFCYNFRYDGTLIHNLTHFLQWYLL
jgi:hypothetical protein